MNDLPHFGLAELHAIEPERLLTSDDDELGAFFLALSLAFNDLKGVLWLSQIMNDAYARENTPPKVSPRGSQMAGLSVQATRYAAGIIHEILKLLREHRSLLESKEFEELGLTPAGREKWRELERFAYSRESENPLVRAFAAIRNSVAFHYYEPKNVAKSFRERFAKSAGNAILSVGRSSEQTRFYYADAAAQTALARCATASNLDADTWENQVRSVLRIVLEATMAGLSAFVATRGGIFPHDADMSTSSR